ncbi:MAG: tetratricopeptide repeat protein [Phenylobacterium sp.]
MDSTLALATAALEEGRREEAREQFEAAMRADPAQSAQTYLTFGRLLYELRRVAEGEQWTARGVALHPQDPALWNLHGVFLRLLRRPRDALAALDRAIAADPQQTSAKVNRGNVLLDLGESAAAEQAFADLTRLEPANPLHWRHLGAALAAQGLAEEARAALRRALDLDAGYAPAWLQLANLENQAGRPEQAVAILDQGLAANPRSQQLLEAKALVLRTSGRLDLALDFLRPLAAAFPQEAWIAFHNGDLLVEIDRAAGEAELRRAFSLAPHDLDVLIALIKSLELSAGPTEAADLDEAGRLAHLALSRGVERPGHTKVLRDVFARLCDFDAVEALGDFRTRGRAWAEAGLHTALLKQIPRVETHADRLELVEQHRIWGRAVEAAAQAAPIRRTPRPRDDRIRVGLMSSDLRRHVVTHFAQPVFDHIDRERFDVYAYSFFQGAEDAVQRRIAGQVSAFRWWPNIAIRDAAQRIANDQLDVLIELGGSTRMNKLEVMAYRPAPIQMSWLGYPQSTGLSAIDYLICDPFNRPTDPALITGQALPLPRSWIALGPEFAGTTPVAPEPPQARRDFVTFGTANNPMKFNRPMLRAWAAIVRQVPNSRFAFIRPEAGAQAFQAHVAAEFAREGVAPDRLAFHAVRGDHLRFYDELDISLDTFPLTGGTTTVEALWMGVPVVSLRGEAFFERLSFSILSNAGLADLAAPDPEAYAQIAVALAADVERLRALRASLRDMLRRGPLGQGEAFARDFYDLIAATAQVRP